MSTNEWTPEEGQQYLRERYGDPEAAKAFWGEGDLTRQQSEPPTNPINPSGCGPDEAYVGTVHGKRRIMVRCARKDALGESVWLVARPDWQSHEYVTDHMVSDLTRLVPYDRGGVPGPTWVERERDMWRDRYRALQSEYARQSQAWSEQRADYEERLARAEQAEARPAVTRAAQLEKEVGKWRTATESAHSDFLQAAHERDEWKARAEAAEARLADPYSQANQGSAAWERVAAHPALRMDLLPEADHSYAGQVFERITWLAETAEAVTEMRPAPAVTREQVADELKMWSQPGMGREPLVDLVCRMFGVEAEATVDPVEEKARELATIAYPEPGFDGAFDVADADAKGAYRRIAAHFLGQEARDE